MTVSNATNRKTFTGDGVTTSFGTTPIVFFESGDLTVYVVTTATGASTTLTENTHYTVSGGSGAVGTVSLAGGSSPYGAPSAAQTLVIVRDLDILQETDFIQNDPSDANVQEEALDRLTMIAQQTANKLARAITLSDSDVSGASTTIPVPEASALIGWNSAGTALQNYTAGDITEVPVSPFMVTVLDDTTATAARSTLLAAGSGAVVSSSITMANARILGRTTVSTGAIEEITVGTGLTLSGGSLTAAAAAVAGAAKNLAARTHASTPNSQLTITADEVVVKDSNGYAMLLSSVSVNPAITASGENGLDTGAEASNTWYYGWVVAKADGTVAGLISASSSAPTMPSGYTFKALVTAVRNDGSSNFIAYRQTGAFVYFPTRQSVLSGGTATSTTSVALSSFVPPSAQEVQLGAQTVVTSGAGLSNCVATIEIVSGSTFDELIASESANTQNAYDTKMLRIPNMSQNVNYYRTLQGAATAGSLTLWVQGFSLPVGR